MPRTNNLSVFLMKTPNRELVDDYVVDGCAKFLLSKGHFYYKLTLDNIRPIWIDSFFGDELNEAQKKSFSTKTVSAIYLIEVMVSPNNKRIFALSFGYGRFLLKKEYIEEEFGINTSKHALDSSQVKSVDTLTYDTSIKHKLIQSVSEIDQMDFSLNSDSDILKGVKGRARMDGLGDLIRGRMIGGRSSVNMSAKVDISNIDAYLKQLYDIYKADDGQGVVYTSNILTIDDENIKEKVDDYLLEQIKNKSLNGIAVDLPLNCGLTEGISRFIVKDRKIDAFGADVLLLYDDIDALKNDYLECEHEDQQRYNISKLFDLIYFETEIDNECYILASGTYYKITKSYKSRVDGFYENLKVWQTDKTLKEWNGESEGNYNKKYINTEFLVMDMKFVTTEGHSKLEFCDLLSCNKEILHVKIHSGSSQILGHLANQGLVSAKALVDGELNKKISDKIKSCTASLKAKNDNFNRKRFEIPQDFKASEYSVVFVLLCKDNIEIKEGKPHMPFFAKSILRENVQLIRNLGFNVCIKAIKETKNN